MATNKNITMKQYNGVDYDTLYPKTIAAQVVGLEDISTVKVFTGTIGTTWTEDSVTGAKTQSIAISGITSEMTAIVDHVYNGSGTAEDYNTFVEAENQYLNYITNGFAQTYNGGIKFTIFGDANTVTIPIIVEATK